MLEESQIIRILPKNCKYLPEMEKYNEPEYNLKYLYTYEDEYVIRDHFIDDTQGSHIRMTFKDRNPQSLRFNN